MSVLKNDLVELRGNTCSRRTFLQMGGLMAGVGATLGGLLPETLAAEKLAASQTFPRQIIDTNISLGSWPFRRLPLDATSALVSVLRSRSVIQAWAGTFEGLLHKNLTEANDRLAEDCRKNGRGMLLPFGSINPLLPGWKEELVRCRQQHRMAGIRLHPNYHGYGLDHPLFAEMLDLALDHGLLVQLAVSMEDERTQHPLARVANVDVSLLPGLLEGRPRARVMLLNWFRSVKSDLLERLAGCQGVTMDLATVEGVGGIGKWPVPLERWVFGSHAPFFYFESAWLKLIETPLNSDQVKTIVTVNARRILSS